MRKKQSIILAVIAFFGAIAFVNLNAAIFSDTGKTATTTTIPASNSRFTTVSPSKESTTTTRPTAEPTTTPERETETTPEPEPSSTPAATGTDTTMENSENRHESSSEPATTETTTPTREVDPTPTPEEPISEPEPTPESTPDAEPTPVIQPTPESEPKPATESTPNPETSSATTSSSSSSETASNPSEPAPTPTQTITQPTVQPVFRPNPAPTPLTPAPEPEDPEATNPDNDQWELIANLPNGMTDDDMDGLSNNIEILAGTSPQTRDTDGDQLTDGEEILDLGTNPLDANDPGRMGDIGIRITNFEENQILTDPQPFIKGVAPISSFIQISAENEEGDVKILGQTQTHENSIFTFVSAPLEDGTYIIRVEEIDESSLIEELFTPAHAQEKVARLVSKPVTITIDTSNKVEAPKPKFLDNQEITSDVLLKNLRVEIENDQPVLKGTTLFRYKVIATWQSVVFSSAIIADSPAGEFEIRPQQKFETGNHEVYVQAVHPTSGAVSEKIRIPFKIVQAENQETQTRVFEAPINPAPPTADIHAAPEEQSFIQSPVLSWIVEHPIPTAVAFGIILLLIFKVAQKEQDNLDPEL